MVVGLLMPGSTEILAGFRCIEPASCWISAENVAENNNVCRPGDNKARMR